MIKSEMPIMRPVPIDTKDQTKYVQIKRWLFSTREWEIMQDWHFTLPNGIRVCIPAGFVFNGASIPRLLWGVLSPTGILFVPSIIHDHGYQHGFLWATADNGVQYKFGTMVTREGWDNIFYQVCRQVNGMKFISGSAYLALWLFGGTAWNKNMRE